MFEVHFFAYLKFSSAYLNLSCNLFVACKITFIFVGANGVFTCAKKNPAIKKNTLPTCRLLKGIIQWIDT